MVMFSENVEPVEVDNDDVDEAFRVARPLPTKPLAPKAPKMTADEAKKFEAFSPTNAQIVEESCENGCVAYEDIFTLRRWNAQGFSVRKGQHATKIDVPVFKFVEDESTGKSRKVRVGSRSVPVFCRCQVAKFKK